jgi:hypothetical protein
MLIVREKTARLGALRLAKEAAESGTGVNIAPADRAVPVGELNASNDDRAFR